MSGSDTFRLRFCEEFPGAPDCCESCHQDMDAGCMEDGYFDLADGDVARVCCSVMRWLDDAGKLA